MKILTIANIIGEMLLIDVIKRHSDFWDEYLKGKQRVDTFVPFTE